MVILIVYIKYRIIFFKAKRRHSSLMRNLRAGGREWWGRQWEREGKREANKEYSRVSQIGKTYLQTITLYQGKAPLRK